MGYKNIRRSFSIQASISRDSILRILSDREIILSSLPCVVARQRDRIKLRFSRLLLFKMEDLYSINVSKTSEGVRISLIGEKSVLNIIFLLKNGVLEYIGEYNGPRQWLVTRCLEEIGVSLNEALLSEAATKVSKHVSDKKYSEKLSMVSWISKLLMRSILVKSEIVAINKGGLISYIENLASSNIFSKYKTVYISGTSDKGTFRLLFVGGELVGVYATIDKDEFIGDERALNNFEGFTRIRVYGSNSEPPE